MKGQPVKPSRGVNDQLLIISINDNKIKKENQMKRTTKDKEKTTNNTTYQLEAKSYGKPKYGEEIIAFASYSREEGQGGTSNDNKC